MNTSVNIAGINLKNPVLTSSGTFGYGVEFEDAVPLNRLGGIISKTVTLDERRGNPPPRLSVTASGMLNSVGLQNVGIEKFMNEKLPKRLNIGVPVLVSLGGGDPEQFASLANTVVKNKNIAGLELNVSCPNVQGKAILATDPKYTAEIIKAVKQAADIPTFVKLSPNVTDIREVAQASAEAGADGISMVNTFKGMSVDLKTRRSRLGTLMGGLSGPAIKPIALRMVYEVAQAVKIPIIATGGVISAEDALEYILCGAAAVCVGTGHFADPKASVRVVEGISKWMKKNGIQSLEEIRGKLEA